MPIRKSLPEDLDKFLLQLPRELRYAVEIRNDNFLDAAHFDVLKANRVAQIFTSWSRMPSLRQQLLIDDALSAPFTTARALVRPGRAYQDAGEVFKPYAKVQEEYPSARQALQDLVKRARELDISAYVHINNRLEGNAIQTIEGIVNSDHF
jgi:uncharacterized protein YecE (DUF72 family)